MAVPIGFGAFLGSSAVGGKGGKWRKPAWHWRPGLSDGGSGGISVCRCMGDGAAMGDMVQRNLGFGLLLTLLAGCSSGMTIDRSKDDALTGPRPAMGWDGRPEAAEWTTSTMAAVARYDSVLAGALPQDIAAWCPGYAKGDLVDRRAFWVGLLSALAKPESSWNPRAAGGGGRYIGLTQISPKTAVANGCEATSAAGLKDGAANLNCAVKIMARQVGQDGVVAGNGRRGLGRDWGPFNRADDRRQMAGWTSRQGYCRQSQVTR